MKMEQGIACPPRMIELSKEMVPMTQQTHILKALGLTFAATALVACGEPVDTASTNEAVSTNLRAMSLTAENNIRVMSKSTLFTRAEVELGVSDEGSDCFGEGCEFEPTPEPAPELDAEFREVADEAIGFLERNIFIEENIEEEKRKKITYLIKGSSVCGELTSDDGDRSACIEAVDKAEVRLVVTSPEEGDVSIDVLVGPNKYNPVSFDVWQNTLAFETSLGGVRDTVVYLANSFEQQDVSNEFPDTFEGRVRLSLTRDGNQKLTGALDVMESIRVQDAQEGYDIRVAVAQPAVSASMNAGTETFSYTVNWNAIDLNFPVTQYIYNDAIPADGSDFESSEEEFTYNVDLHLDGAKGTVILDAANEVLKLKGISLGNGPLTLDIDSKRVLEVALANAFDVTAKEAQGGVEAVFAPGVDFGALFSFKNLDAETAEHVDAEEWMMDDELKLSFTGDSPTILIEDDTEKVKVVSGALVIKSTARDLDILVEANQCLIEEEPAVCEPTPVIDGMESGEDFGCDYEYDGHPFANLTSGACE